MKNKILSIILFILVFAFSFISCNAQDLNRIAARCPGTRLFASVNITVGNNVITPCASGSTIFNGAVDFSGATITGATGFVTGTGTTNFVPRWTNGAGSVIGNTPFSWDGTSYVLNNTALNSQVIANFTPALTGSFDVGDYTTTPTSYVTQNYNTNITTIRSTDKTQFNLTTDAISCGVSNSLGTLSCRDAANTDIFEFDANGGNLTGFFTTAISLNSPTISVGNITTGNDIFTQTGGTITMKSGVNDSIVTSRASGNNQYKATLNHIFSESGTETFRIATLGQFLLNRTITAAGTTGARTIDKPAGTVNFAAAAAAIIVTNSTATANSLIFCTVQSLDTTAISCRVTDKGAGVFTIRVPAATAETSVAFWVTN